MLFRSSRSRPSFPEGWTLELQSGPGAPLSFPLTSTQVILGRDPGCDICLQKDHRISRRHAVITFEDGEWLVDDLGSANGTFVGRERVLRITPLDAGDEVSLGQTMLVLQPPAPPAPVLELVGSDFDGLETQPGELAAAPVELPTDWGLGLAAELETTAEAEPAPEMEEPGPPVEPSAESAPAPVPAPEAPAVEPTPEPSPPTPPEPEVLTPAAVRPGSAGEGIAQLEWTPDGLGAVLHLLGDDADFTGRVRQALADLQVPAGVSATLTEALGETGVDLHLQVAAGGQPQLLIVTGEVIARLTQATVCGEVPLPM